MKLMISGRRLFFFIIIALISSGNLHARLYFIHIPKTGGTTLRLLLEQQISTREIYPFKNLQTAKGPIDQDLVVGHLPYWYCKETDPEFDKAFKVTILRDPIERYLSFLRAKKKADASLPTLESVLRKDKYRVGLIDNAMCRHLSENPNFEGEALLESAKKNLHAFDEIIFYSQYTPEIVNFFVRLGIALQEEEIPRINVTAPEYVSPPLLEEVVRINQLDIQLYEYAKTHYVKRDNRYQLRTSSYEELTKTKTEIDYTFDLPLNGQGWTYRDISNAVFRWVTDQPASIYFSLEEQLDYDLFFTAAPITQDIYPQVKVNGEEVSVSQLNTEAFSLYHAIIPRELIQNRPTQILFFSSKAYEYRDVHPQCYNRNHPPLSFAVNQIQIIKR